MKWFLSDGLPGSCCQWELEFGFVQVCNVLTGFFDVLYISQIYSATQ